MTPLLFILSSPVRSHDGTFVVMTGTVAGVSVKQFPTLPAAQRYQTVQRMLWCAAADFPIDFVLITDARDAADLASRCEQEIELRTSGRPTCVAAPAPPVTFFGRMAARMLSPGPRPSAH